MKLLKHSLFALLAAPAIVTAHPGHVVLDPSTGLHAGHEAELLLFALPAVAVIALALRAIRSAR